MIKLAQFSRRTGSDWHVMLSGRPGDWFIGERCWPSIGRPVLLLRGMGPLHLRRFLSFDEADAIEMDSTGMTMRAANDGPCE